MQCPKPVYFGWKRFPSRTKFRQFFSHWNKTQDKWDDYFDRLESCKPALWFWEV